MSMIVGFNYGSLASGTRKAVKQHTEALRELMRRSVEDYIEMGRRLADVRDLTKGVFKLWCVHELGMCAATAFRMIRVSEKFGNLEGPILKKLSYAALQELAKETVADAAITEALDKAKSGERLTHAGTREIVKRHPRNYVKPRGTWAQKERERVEAGGQPEEWPEQPEQPRTATSRITAVKRYVEQAVEALSVHDQFRLADELLEIVMKIRSNRAARHAGERELETAEA